MFCELQLVKEISRKMNKQKLTKYQRKKSSSCQIYIFIFFLLNVLRRIKVGGQKIDETSEKIIALVRYKLSAIFKPSATSRKSKVNAILNIKHRKKRITDCCQMGETLN
tara:strand:- start:89 stop:415 length:327 start_codon:yes stop_codon:yes gene_type:complete